MVRATAKGGSEPPAVLTIALVQPHHQAGEYGEEQAKTDHHHIACKAHQKLSEALARGAGQFLKGTSSPGCRGQKASP